MSPRNNMDRFGAPQPSHEDPVAPAASQAPQQTSMQFVVPTEMVNLPSRGRFYPESHPLHGKETVEIRYMTARDEDILVNKSFIQKGLVVDKLLESVIIDKNIPISSLLLGDKNAMIVAARVSGYGSEYETKIVCPSCMETQDYSFDLDEALTLVDESDSELEHSVTPSGTFIIKTPKMGLDVEFRPTTGYDEKAISKANSSRKKNKLSPMGIIDVMAMYIVSIDGNPDKGFINQALEHMPAIDAKYIRTCHQELMPNIDLAQQFECNSCGYEQEMEVPFTSDFFWPK